jgi:hypothetical protein
MDRAVPRFDSGRVARGEGALYGIENRIPPLIPLLIDQVTTTACHGSRCGSTGGGLIDGSSGRIVTLAVGGKWFVACPGLVTATGEEATRALVEDEIAETGVYVPRLRPRYLACRSQLPERLERKGAPS